MIVKRLDPRARLPMRSTPGSAGLDLTGIDTVEILPGMRQLVRTGLQVKVPSGCYGRIAPRSGLALKNGIDVLAGVVDCDYEGEVGVVLLNTGETPFSVTTGDRIAQLIIERIEMVDVIEVDRVEVGGARGAGGFGSSDANNTQSTKNWPHTG